MLASFHPARNATPHRGRGPNLQQPPEPAHDDPQPGPQTSSAADIHQAAPPTLPPPVRQTWPTTTAHARPWALPLCVRSRACRGRSPIRRPILHLPPASPPRVAVQSFAPKPQHHLPTQPRRKAPAPSRAEPVGRRQNTAAPDGQRLLEPAAQRTLDRATQHRSPPGGRLWAHYGGLARLGVPHARLACPR